MDRSTLTYILTPPGVEFPANYSLIDRLGTKVIRWLLLLTNGTDIERYRCMVGCFLQIAFGVANQFRQQTFLNRQQGSHWSRWHHWTALRLRVLRITSAPESGQMITSDFETMLETYFYGYCYQVERQNSSDTHPLRTPLTHHILRFAELHDGYARRIARGRYRGKNQLFAGLLDRMRTILNFMDDVVGEVRRLASEPDDTIFMASMERLGELDMEFRHLMELNHETTRSLEEAFGAMPRRKDVPRL